LILAVFPGISLTEYIPVTNGIELRMAVDRTCSECFSVDYWERQRRVEAGRKKQRGREKGGQKEIREKTAYAVG
jgi:hypothetical protein